MSHIQRGYHISTIPFINKMVDINFSAICFLSLSTHISVKSKHVRRVETDNLKLVHVIAIDCPIPNISQ